MQRYKLSWYKRFTEIRWHSKRWQSKLCARFNNEIRELDGKRVYGTYVSLWFWIRFQWIVSNSFTAKSPNKSQRGFWLSRVLYAIKERCLVHFHGGLERVLLGTLKVTDLSYPAFDPLGQNQPENLPAFPEKSSGEHVLNSHDRTVTDPTACGLHTRQRFPRHVMPTWANWGPYLQNFPTFMRIKLFMRKHWWHWRGVPS